MIGSKIHFVMQANKDDNHGFKVALHDESNDSIPKEFSLDPGIKSCDGLTFTTS